MTAPSPLAPALPSPLRRPTLALGAMHPAVREVQARLNLFSLQEQTAGRPGLGEPLAVDGVFGPRTRAAVLAFQAHAFPGDLREHDGVVGPRTWAALDLATGAPLPPPDPPEPTGPPPTADRGTLRAAALALLRAYVPSDAGDPDGRFAEIAADYGPACLERPQPPCGTTCGFLAHWLLWRLGCVNREVMNRSAPGGYVYRVGQNISRIYGNGGPPFHSALHGALQRGERPGPGDLVFLRDLAGDSRTEHVFVFAARIPGEREVWISADAGQRNEAGRECARERRRELSVPPGGQTGTLTGQTARTVIGWLPLSALEFGPPPLPLPVATSEAEDAEANSHTADLSDAFFVGLRAVAASIGTDPLSLLRVMMAESGIRADAVNPGSQASGLIQFMPSTLTRLGWTAGPAAFRALGAEAQLPFAERYFLPFKSQGLSSTARLYQATFLPATLSQGSAPDTVIAGRDGPHASAYAANRGLDTRGDGTIRVGDLTAAVQRQSRGPRWEEAYRRLEGSSAPPDRPPVPVPPTPGHPTLRRGSRGPEVREAQGKLNAVHAAERAEGRPGLDPAPLDEDGIYGARTQSAVRSFQRLVFPGQPDEHDGILGPKTWAQLDLRARETPTVPPGPTPPGPGPQPTPTPPRPADWFLTDAEMRASRGGAARTLSLFSTQNEVTPLIDGEAMMSALKADIDGCGSGDQVWLTAWQLHADVRMRPGAPGPTVLDTLGGAVRRGVAVRVLLWRNQLVLDRPASPDTVTALERAGVTVITDARHPSFGSIHQKTAIIVREGSLHAYVGGIDLAHDRWDTRRHDGDPRRVRHDFAGWHDVHARVRGPAAHDLALNFLDRWNDGGKWPSIVPPVRPPAPLPVPARPGAAGTRSVQVLRTFACASGQYPGPAPRGEFSYHQAYLKVIARAQRYVYIEDQYLVSPEIAAALAAALPRLGAVVIVVPRFNDNRGKNPRVEAAFNWHQERFIRTVRARDPRKIHLFDLRQPATGQEIYVHAKVMIVDDVYAAIGSQNINQRSETHDAEVGVAVMDEPGGGATFARDLRLDLWSEHLGLPPGDPRLADPVAAAAEWDRQAATGRARVHPHVVPTPQDEHAILWSRVVDPDGRCTRTA